MSLPPSIVLLRITVALSLCERVDPVDVAVDVVDVGAVEVVNPVDLLTVSLINIISINRNSLYLNQ